MMALCKNKNTMKLSGLHLDQEHCGEINVGEMCKQVWMTVSLFRKGC